MDSRLRIKCFLIDKIKKLFFKKKKRESEGGRKKRHESARGPSLLALERPAIHKHRVLGGGTVFEDEHPQRRTETPNFTPHHFCDPSSSGT